MYRPGPAGKDWTVWMLLRRTKSILRLSATVFSVLFGLQEPRGSCCCYCCCPHRKGRWRGWKGSSQTWLPLDIFIITATSSETIIGTAHPDQKKEMVTNLCPNPTKKARELSCERKCLSTNGRHAKTFIYAARYTILDLVLHYCPLWTDTNGRNKCCRSWEILSSGS